MKLNEQLAWQEEITTVGVWVPINGYDSHDSCEVHVAPAENSNFQKRYRFLEKQYLLQDRKKRVEDLSADRREELFTRAMFGTVVLGWRGLEDDEGDLEFNEKNFLFVMNNLWKFSEQVLMFATETATFASENHEVIEKN